MKYLHWKVIIAIILLVFFIKVVKTIEKETFVTVHTPSGKVRGQVERKKSFKGNDYISFYGIPYAAPPIGALRFEDPENFRGPFKDTFNATTPTTCLQIYHTLAADPEPIGSEDCLHLNVFLPGGKIPPTGGALDVIVHIHGGAFMFSAGHEVGEKYLMDYDVLYVSLNYRLGIFGFLSSGDAQTPGNFGLKDQRKALQWIQTNIAAFGGNPASVTLTGLSAGGASVHMHMNSPLSKGLFHRALSQSGTAMNPWTIQDKPAEKYRTLVTLLGCKKDEKDENTKKCLKSKDGVEVARMTNRFRSWYFNPFSPFAPVVDAWAEEPFLPAHPFYALLEQNLESDVPWIASVTTAEGLYPGADFTVEDFALFQELADRWEDLMPKVLHYEDVTFDGSLNLVSQKIRQKYFPQANPDESLKLSKDNFRTLVELIGDRLFLSDFDSAIRLQVHATASSASKTWVYRFNYTAEHAHSLTFIRQDDRERYGVAYGDDTVLMFDLPKTLRKEATRTGDDLGMQTWLLRMMVHFARTGEPGVDSWTPMTRSNQVEFLDVQGPDDYKMAIVDEFGQSTWWRRLMLHENEFFKLTQIDLAGLPPGWQGLQGQKAKSEKTEKNKDKKSTKNVEKAYEEL